MPAPLKVAKDRIVASALQIVVAQGVNALTVRALAKALGCSTQPIYFQFENLDALKRELKKEAERRYFSIASDALSGGDRPYLRYGLAYVRFAREEKELFRLLYLDEARNGENRKNLEDVNAARIRETLTAEFGFDERTADLFHRDMAIYSYGLAAALNTGHLDLTDAEIEAHFTAEFRALSLLYAQNTNRNETWEDRK